MNKETDHPKRPRIKEFEYKGNFAYFLTICAHLKQKAFTSKDVIELVMKQLKETTKQHNFGIYAYCFMPDHLHLLVIAQNDAASLKEFIKVFKQKSGFYYKQNYSKQLWQPSFYDHVLRKKEDLNQIAEYIFNNPVRQGLVDDYHKYPNLGSLMFHI